MKNHTSFHQPVSVIIPNYNGCQLLEKNVPAVLKMMRASDELLIMDDLSTDDSVTWLCTRFDLKKIDADNNDYQIFENTSRHIRVVQNKKNVRFGANCNRGVKLARSPYILLFNSDVTPEPDVITQLLPYFVDKTLFAVGCREIEINSDGTILSGGKNQLRFQRGMFIHARATEFESGETAWVSGGSGMFDREKWLQLGGFEKAYAPAYWEDIDLAFRAHAHGWKLLFEKNAVVHHNHETTNITAFGEQKIARMSWRNANVFVRRNGSLLQKIQYFLWQPYWWWKIRL